MSELSYEQLLESLFDGVYYVDRERVIHFWNKAAERITGFTKVEVVGKSCADNILKHVDEKGRELCGLKCPINAMLEDGKVHETNAYLRHKLGHRVPVSVRVSPVVNNHGKVIGGIEVFIDNSSQMQIIRDYAKIKNEAYMDPVAETSNRRYCETVINTKLYELKSFKVPFGIIYLDIDEFKGVNDRFDHRTGDQVLRMVAKTAENVLRKQDTVARWSGDEFVIVVPNVSEGAIEMVAERLRVLIKESFLLVNNQEVQVTVSLGATMAKPEDTVAFIVKRADDLMTLSKQAGKNRVSVG